MNHTTNTQRTRSTYGTVVLIGTVLGLLVLSAGQVGCSTIAGGMSGAVHGLADDLDGLTDKLAKDKQQRQEARGNY